MIIDAHGHLVPPASAGNDPQGAIAVSVAAAHRKRPSLALAFAGGKPTRPIMKGLSDTAGRLAWMARQGIDRQVSGGWPDWFGNDLPAGRGRDLVPDDQRGAACRRQGRAALRAARERADAGRRAGRGRAEGRDGKAGFPGAMISTLPRGIGSVLDAGRPRPVLEGGRRHRRGRSTSIRPFDAGEEPRERLRPGQRRRPGDATRWWRCRGSLMQRARDALHAMPSSSCRSAPAGCRSWSGG